MTKYLILIYEDEAQYATATPQVWDEIMKEHQAFPAKVEGLGAKLVGGEALQPTETATSLRSGGQDVTDGPFVETKEQLAGYYVVDCADLDEAIAWAKKVPAVLWGAAVEVRPVAGGTDVAENSDAAGTAAS